MSEVDIQSNRKTILECFFLSDDLVNICENLMTGPHATRIPEETKSKIINLKDYILDVENSIR